LGDITIPAVTLAKVQKRVEKPKGQPQPKTLKGWKRWDGDIISLVVTLENR
jgi:hypothetical protein